MAYVPPNPGGGTPRAGGSQEWPDFIDLVSNSREIKGTTWGIGRARVELSHSADPATSQPSRVRMKCVASFRELSELLDAVMQCDFSGLEEATREEQHGCVRYEADADRRKCRFLVILVEDEGEPALVNVIDGWTGKRTLAGSITSCIDKNLPSPE